MLGFHGDCGAVGIYVLYCIVLYCIVLYCIVLYCIVLYCIVLYCIVLYCIVLYCIVLYCIVLYCIVLYCIPVSPPHASKRLICVTEWHGIGQLAQYRPPISLKMLGIYVKSFGRDDIEQRNLNVIDLIFRNGSI